MRDQEELKECKKCGLYLGVIYQEPGPGELIFSIDIQVRCQACGTYNKFNIPYTE